MSVFLSACMSVYVSIHEFNCVCVYVCVCVCVCAFQPTHKSRNLYLTWTSHHTPRSSYFLATSFFTGMVISEAWMACMASGASTVSMPSGDRLDCTFSTLAVGGSLHGGGQQGQDGLEWRGVVAFYPQSPFN